MSKPGRNSGKVTNVAMERVKSFVDRLERMEEERKAIGDDIKDIYTEAKGVGFDVKTLRWLVGERKVKSSDRAERDALRATYANALGMAVELVEVNGLSLRQAEKRTGISKSSIQRALTVPKASQPAPHNPETGEITKPEDGGDGITDAALRADAPLGIPQIAGVIPPAVKPDPESREGSGTHSDEAPATPSVGAVASESERVASSSDDDDLDIPAHLRGPSPANRRVA